MKKYFLMALLASIIIMPGCKKSDSVTSDNFFYKQLKVAESIIGENQSSVESILTKNGWVYSESLSDVSEGGLAYTSNNSLGIVYVHFELLSSKTMDFGIAYSVDYGFQKGYTAELADEKAYREFVSHLGASPNICGVKFAFDEYYYSKGDGDDYDVFMNDFTTIYSSNEWSATWWADDGSKNARYFMFGKTSDMTTMGLVLGID